MKKIIIIMAAMVLVAGLAWADQIVEYYCPKCGSTDISRVCTDPPPKTVRASMDQIVKDTQIIVTDLVIRYRNMQAVCNQCGYTVKYSTPF